MPNCRSRAAGARAAAAAPLALLAAAALPATLARELQQFGGLIPSTVTSCTQLASAIAAIAAANPKCSDAGNSNNAYTITLSCIGNYLCPSSGATDVQFLGRTLMDLTDSKASVTIKAGTRCTTGFARPKLQMPSGAFDAWGNMFVLGAKSCTPGAGSAGSLTLQNIIIDLGRSGGRAIRAENADQVTLTNVDIQNSQTAGAGGAILASDTQVTIQRGQFVNVSASVQSPFGASPADYPNGGAIFIRQAYKNGIMLSAVGTKFSKCAAGGPLWSPDSGPAFGGSIYYWVAPSSPIPVNAGLQCRNCQFVLDKNTPLAKANGQAIYTQRNYKDPSDPTGTKAKFTLYLPSTAFIDGTPAPIDDVRSSFAVITGVTTAASQLANVITTGDTGIRQIPVDPLPPVCISPDNPVGCSSAFIPKPDYTYLAAPTPFFP